MPQLKVTGSNRAPDGVTVEFRRYKGEDPARLRGEGRAFADFLLKTLPGENFDVLLACFLYKKAQGALKRDRPGEAADYLAALGRLGVRMQDYDLADIPENHPCESK